MSTTDALLAAARGWELRPLLTPARRIAVLTLDAMALGVLVAVIQYAAAVR